MAEDIEPDETLIMEVPAGYSDVTAQRLDAFGILILRLDKVKDSETRAAAMPILDVAIRSIPTAEGAKVRPVK